MQLQGIAHSSQGSDGTADHFVGTATCSTYQCGENQIKYILTCAHNVAEIEKRSGVVGWHRDLVVFERR